jgi:nitrite reductase/ring-hydroxylating ferredoxin subunit
MQVPQHAQGSLVRKVLKRVSEVPENGAVAAEVESSTGGFSLVLTRVDGVINAFHNECPHAGRRLDWSPGRFLIENGMLICAAHGATFNIGTGECIGGPSRGAGLKRVHVVVDAETDEVSLG